MAELTLVLMLAAARNVPQTNQSIRDGGWNRVTGCELGGKVLGIVGLGAIGIEVVKRAKAFDMQIVAYA